MVRSLHIDDFVLRRHTLLESTSFCQLSWIIAQQIIYLPRYIAIEPYDLFKPPLAPFPSPAHGTPALFLFSIVIQP